MKILLVLLIIFFSISGVHAETAQYYNETSGQMEIPIYVNDNYISFCSLENGNLSVFDSLSPRTNDIIYKYNNSRGWESVQYGEGYGWYGNMGEFATIEAGICYKYYRKVDDTTWTYDTEFYCENCEDGGVVIVETVYVSPDYENAALLFYIFIIPILYLFVAFKKRVSTTNLSMIFLIFAFSVLLFQVITISVNIIYIIIFLFLFITSIAGITLKQGAD